MFDHKGGSLDHYIYMTMYRKKLVVVCIDLLSIDTGAREINLRSVLESYLLLLHLQEPHCVGFYCRAMGSSLER